MVTKMIGVKEFRQNIAEYYRQARKYDLRFIILNRNKPMFEVRPLTENDATLEKLALDVAQARAEYKKGKVYSSADVRALLGL